MYESKEKIVIKCDQESIKFMDTAKTVYLACQDHLKAGSLLADFEFGKSHDMAGLQVADFVAYYALQLRRDMLEGKDNLIDKPWWPMEQLLGMFIPEFEYFVAPQLWEINHSPTIHFLDSFPLIAPFFMQVKPRSGTSRKSPC